LASSLISVEKSKVCPGRAEVPKKLGDRGVKHVVAAFILAGIRESVPKRRRWRRGYGDNGAGVPPGILHEYQKKRLRKFAIRN